MSNPAPGFKKHSDYEVDIAPLGRQLEVRIGTTIIARSDAAVLLSETGHRPTWYIPQADIDAALIHQSQTRTYCPFKGNASYWHIETDDRRWEDAIWAYLEPYDECSAISTYVSFYTNKVDVYIDGEIADNRGPGWVE